MDGQELWSHEDKTAAITSYFAGIMGASIATSWSFDVQALYSGRARASGALTAPFSEAEAAAAAVRSMNRCSAPGPDGFGPSFYKAAWSTVEVQVMDLLGAFHRNEVDLERINRAYMVLLPKNRGVCQWTPSDRSAYRIAVSRLSQKYSPPGCSGRLHPSLIWIRQGSFEAAPSQRILCMLWSLSNAVIRGRLPHWC